ncbi:MAG TPA: tyrosine-type recombinase/integrase, partial [Flavobacterium sp.]|nr:tyrosine-type recombinase/integrase [Flavobacterium sp.]
FVKKYDNDNNQASRDAYKAKLKKLRDYTGGKLSFDDLDVRFVRNYINHLVTEHKNSVNGYAVDLRKIRAIYIAASKEGFADRNKNPFIHVKIKTEKTKKERLTKEELELIRKADIDGYLVDARNIFLFCVNCMGMRIGDAMRIKWANISDDYILYSMNKTKDAISIKMTSEVKKIVGYYKGKTDFYVFPYLQKDCNEYEVIKTKTALVNKALKLISGKATVNKKVSTHISRHTYAQLALNSGADPRVLQKAFGHSTYTTTENYVGELSFKEVNDLNDSIFD